MSRVKRSLVKVVASVLVCAGKSRAGIRELNGMCCDWLGADKQLVPLR